MDDPGCKSFIDSQKEPSGEWPKEIGEISV